MGDINQEWKELRMKNGNFINHIDGELAKIEKEKRLLDEQKEQIFYDPMTCTYFNADPEEIQKKFESMQSKIAKQSNEINRLAHENVGLAIDMKRYRIEIEKLKQALGTSAKDAEGNFDRGYHRGMDELWAAIRKAQEEPHGALQDIYGQDCMYDCISNLSAQDFAKKTIEWEEKQAKDIQIGDEVEILDIYDPDLRGDIGIVVVADSERHYFVAVGPNFESHFDETDIQDGNVRKTGQHFDSIPLNYFA